MEFGQHLRTLRTSQGLSQKQLADILNISPSTIGMYEQNRRIPDLKMLKEIASVFEVSLDSLLDNNFTNDTSIGNFIRQVRIRHNFSQKDFAQLFNLKKSDIVAYENSIKFPTHHSLKLICDYFNIDINKFLPIQTQDSSSSLSDREQDLLFTFRQLTKDDQDIIIGDAKKYLKEQQKSKI